MIAKVKTYLIIAGIVIIASVFVTANIYIKKYQKEKAARELSDKNLYNQLAENLQIRNFTLTQKQVIGQVKRERDSIAFLLKIKPKQVEKITEIVNTIHDTVKIVLPVKITGKNEWLVEDSTACLRYTLKCVLRGDTLTAERVKFDFSNQITEVFYRKRPHKFLFIHFGKWQYYEKSGSKCGNTEVKNINFVK